MPSVGLPGWTIRPNKLVAALGVALCAIACPGLADDQTAPAREVQDLPYGNALFEFYQEHYFTTLTDLMVSEHFNRVQHHSEESELLRGGILLSYGLHREAGQLFQQLIDSSTAPVTRDRAWFYLAKIRYQRGYLADAERALGRIGNALPASLQEERALLQANLMMAREDYAGAATVLAPLADSKDATPSDYVKYNLGIALVRSGNGARGAVLLDQLGVTHEDDEEHRRLRDRANLVLGFAALQAHQPADKYFERIRLKGAEADKALLGLGWARVQNKDYKQALVPWQELAQRTDNDAAELEARIAVPYAYAQLGAFGQSARLYNDAINAFGAESRALDESISAIRAGKLVSALLADNPGQDMGWFWSIRELPDMPHAAHLSQVLARHEFQEAFKNYRDLLFLDVNLHQWHDKLGIFADMLENRRTAFAEHLPQVTEQTSKAGLDALLQRSTNLVTLETQAQADADGIAYADGKQIDLLKRLADARALIDRHPGDPEFAAADQRVRLARGALIWQLAEDYPQRSWDNRQALQDLAAKLQQAQLLESALMQAQKDEPARFDDLAQRIAAIGKRVDDMLPRVAELQHQQQLAVQEMAVAQLLSEQTLLAQYADQARFALAQLYDRGADQSGDTPHAQPQAEQGGSHANAQ